VERPRFTSEANRDLAKIVRYLGARNPGAATRLCDGIERECWRLARNPEIGVLRPDLAPLLRFFPFKKYLIFYRKSPEGIHVIRVIHSARDYRSSDFQ
jgi:toxin ParE1/3/4